MFFNVPMFQPKLQETSTKIATLGAVLVLAAIYFGAAKLGLSLAFEAEQVTIVWPSSGIALAAILLLGNRIIPGIMLGAFLANITLNEPFATACGIALGNSLEAISAAWFLRSVGFDLTLSRVRDVLHLLVSAVVVSSMLCATIGVIFLCIGGAQPWEMFGSLWFQWWLGDAAGILIVTPLLLVWARKSKFHSDPPYRVEAIFLVIGVVLTTLVIFTRTSSIGSASNAILYIIFPFIIWAALRFGQRGTSFITLAASAIAIFATVHGYGPFRAGTVNQSLLLLQIFMPAVAVTGLFLAAAITESREAEKRAELASHAKSDFLANMSHEIRTPMNNVIGMTELLFNTNLTAEQQEYARAIHQAGNVLLTVINDILDFSKIEAGELILQARPIKIDSLVEEAVSLFKVPAYLEHIDLRMSCRLEYPLVIGDPVRLKQILTNLIGNAIKFTQEGAVTIQVTQQAAINNTVMTLFEVTDTGIGIAPDKMDKLFIKFSQLDDFTHKKFSGTGLGLTISKQLTTLMGGNIGVTSEEGKGSTFWFRIPFQIIKSRQDTIEQAPAFVTPHEGTQILSQFKGHILIAEDYPQNQQLEKIILEKFGCTVDIAENGEEVLEKLKTSRYDIIFMDNQMPEMDGFEATARIRQNEHQVHDKTHTIIVGLTANALIGDREKNIAAGMDDYISKPITLPEVERILRKYLPATSPQASQQLDLFTPSLDS